MQLLRTPIGEDVHHHAEPPPCGERHHGVLVVDQADDLLAVEQPPDIARDGSSSWSELLERQKSSCDKNSANSGV